MMRRKDTLHEKILLFCYALACNLLLDDNSLLEMTRLNLLALISP